MRVSVAICTYNGEQFLKEQLDSILNQSTKVDEIVVCDDKSTDKTLEILNNYKKQHPDIFHIHSNEINLRSVKNFEKAIKLCKGDIIFLSDQDDKWAIDKVSHYLEYFFTHSKINVLTSNGYCINENSEEEEKYSLWDIPQFLKESNVQVNYHTIISHISNIATGASMAFRKEIINDILPFPSSDIIHHDEWIALISSQQNKFELLQEKLFYYRIHTNQQVGSVFFEKSEKLKQSITSIYNLNTEKNTFTALKRRLRKLLSSYEKSIALSNIETKFKKHFISNSEDIKIEYYKTIKNMEKSFFFQTTLLKIKLKLKGQKINLD
ncbi:glycosyltransferase family 2 protein [Flavobacterium terrae]|uniref:Glycosyltransferase involved in cell wall bisynthesis n=1 Tax=Flavobacterium terrae TaxID=415425 RepID=A0A1M6CQV7_9FLAO|nr:glycosyltransferase family 2 protein [Flavobacterium terrae]SHI63366.1 Glycosyltransferase involved in cell wall bisynthesis [Flavobacterium terrae]